MTDGRAFRGEWQATTLYNPGDIVDYGGNLYLVVNSFTSGSVFADNISNVTVFSSQIGFREDWQAGTRYGVNDVVRYNGIVYKCTQEHTSDNPTLGLEADQSKWTILYEGIEYRGAWQTATRYRSNDLVKLGGTVYRCLVGHTSTGDGSDDFTQSNYWAVELSGFKSKGTWNGGDVYSVGDVVRAGGYLYYARKANAASNPVDSIYQGGADPDWQILSRSLRFRGDKVSTQYKTGDVVRRGGNLWLALLDTTTDDSTLDYLDTSNWLILTESINWRNFWRPDQLYAVNDLVMYRGSTYKCNIDHESSVQNFPGDNGSGFDYWDLLIQASFTSGLSEIGDLLTYDLSRGLAGDGSTVDVTSVPVGNQGELLSIDNQDSVIYKTVGHIARVRYVDINGVDDTTDTQRGISPFKPWRTVRFACEQVDDGFDGFTTIRVAAGRYDEILPIIVPKNTAVVGTELRTTTINAAGPVSSLSLDSPYTDAVLVRLSQIIQGIVTGTILSSQKTPGNPLDPVIPTRTVTTSFFNSGTGEITTVETEEDIIGSSEAASDVIDLIDEIRQYIDYYVNSTGTDVTLVGTNTAIEVEGFSTEVEGFLDAALVLEANKEFLAEEAVAYMLATFPEYDFVPTLCKRDVRRYVDAWKYDIIYTGNYKSLLAARYYRNAILGSQSEDMFYLRDSTGLRNCTVTGLTGVLTPPNVNDLYRVPTGGAFCSLDPGWGPDDDRTWIISRSPYIQGVTTIGNGCVGQKIDGALHNGGNKSMVSNDFTQVLSDGVGAWVTNNGRAELVSVFTYYCHVGYLAKDGGIIRGTNGNCSYGRFGAISDGVDLTEIPKTTTVNTRNNSAIVSSALTSDATEEIFLFEYGHCGENYSTASATIVGSGVNASTIFDDFRDNAIFESRRVDTSENIVESIGGGGYTVAQSNAQEGDTLSITIASNDASEEANYLGMRMIIVSGVGAGQYGYITSYDTETKIVTVSRESDDQPGWDHVVAGTPSAPTLGTSTSYRIEPRVTFSAPEYSATDVSLNITADWSGAVYGETTESYTDLPGGLGTGVVVEDDGLEPLQATFDVTKVGRSYEVTLNRVGAGYAVGDTLTILGTALGGETPTHDLSITVTGVSDDSTNSITTFIHDGVGSSGRFVIVSSDGTAGVYSKDGDTWSSFNMPTSGDWTCLASGNNRFVAIRRNSSVAASSLNGTNWVTRAMPSSRLWSGVVYGNDRFVAVAENLNSAAYSTDGTTWTASTMPSIGDSTINNWVDITYGKGRFVALANSNNIVAESEDGITWEGHIMDVIDDSTQKDWTSIAYGNNRFVAISSTGEAAYSFDAETWYPATMPTADGSTAHYWRKIRYAQGVFFAIGDTGSRDVEGDETTGPSAFSATSPDGIVWTSRILDSAQEWRTIAFGNPYINELDSTIGKSTPMWITVATGIDTVNKIRTGARALGRVSITAGVISEVKIWDPGSGYQDEPTLTLTSPNKTSSAVVNNRLGDGVLAQPSWLNRGFGYKIVSTRVSISGNGIADIYPVGKFVTISALPTYPGPGAQIIFSGNPTRYTIVTVESKTLEIGGEGFSARIRVSPELRNRDDLEHGTSAIIRESYSQVRITGHDFLDIGTGNFEQTNYPEIYSTGLYTPAPENEVVEEDGGRVFYASTDQTGNFRTGELFAVEQATGIVTISADFFDLSGLSELRLGGIRVGGTGAVIREFSTDPLFIEDSNNIVPTQRAIRAYLQNRLTVGGSEIAVGSFIAGTVLIGPDRINNVAGLRVVFPLRTEFDGADSQIDGSILAQTMFFRSFNIE
jgi:hypothetical protein